MQSKPRGLAAAVVLCAIPHSVSAAPATNNMDKPSATSVETRSVTVPATATLQPDSQIESAAAAARRDQDPDLNGSMKARVPVEAPAASLAR